MTWATPVLDLRTELSDGATDKVRSRMAVFGKMDGDNKRFKTLEPRRVTDFTTATVPSGVYVNNVLVAVTSDDLVMGEFELTTAPDEGDTLEASYYVQWFTDAELDTFLKNAAAFVGLANSYTQIPFGLQMAALKYSCADAYQKLAIRWSEFLSTQFRAEDMPKTDTKTPQDMYLKMAQGFRKEAKDLRDDYYKRQGRQLSPISGTVRGRARNVVR